MCSCLRLQKAVPSCTAATASVVGPRSSSSVHSIHYGNLPRSAVTAARPFDHYGPRHRHPAPRAFSPLPVHGFIRQNMNVNPGFNPGPRGLADTSIYRAPTSSVGVHGDYARQSFLYHQLDHSQGYTPVSWAGPPGAQAAQMPVQQGQEKWLGPPPQAYAVQQMPGQLTPESLTSSPMYAQYSPQVVPPPSYGTSQPQYSPVVPPPNQQLFIVANAQLVPGGGVQQTPPSGQFTPSVQPPYQIGFVPAGQPAANQSSAVPLQSQQAVSSAGLGCIVASPPQQYVVANQQIVMQPAPVNQQFVAHQYTKTAPPNVVPQQFVMMPTQQYVVPPPSQPGMPPPSASQVYSLVTNQNAPRPNGPPPYIVQPVLAGQRTPLQVAAVPNQFQPIAVPANQLQVLPTNQIPPMAVSHLQMVPANALQVVSTNQPPPPMAPADQMQSVATSQLASAPQPVYCYVPSASVAWPTNELRPTYMPVNPASSMHQLQPTATANIQVSVFNQFYIATSWV